MKRILCLLLVFNFFIMFRSLILNNRTSFGWSVRTIWSSFIDFFCRLIIIIILLINRKFEDIIFKISFFFNSIGKNHSSKSMLNSLFPFTYIFATINPKHFTLAMTFILVKVSFVNISTCPYINTFALFQIIQKIEKNLKYFNI